MHNDMTYSTERLSKESKHFALKPREVSMFCRFLEAPNVVLPVEALGAPRTQWATIASPRSTSGMLSLHEFDLRRYTNLMHYAKHHVTGATG